MPKIVPITINGETHSIRKWAKISGLSDTTIRNRIKKGLQGEELLKPIRLKQEDKQEDEDKYGMIYDLWHGKWVYIGNNEREARAKELQKRR